mgnify:CR=1 FL=1
MGIRVRLCSDWCLREADILSDYPQTSVSCIVRTQYPYFAQRYAGITGFGPVVLYALKFFQRSRSRNISRKLTSSIALDPQIVVIPKCRDMTPPTPAPMAKKKIMPK